MAMDYERALISKAVRDQAFSALIDGGITEEHFLDPEHLEKFQLLREHYDQHGASMGIDAFQENYPVYKLPEVPEPVSWYLERIREELAYRIAAAISGDAVALLKDGEISQAVTVLIEGAADLAGTTQGSSDRDATRTSKSRTATYEEWAAEPGAMRGWSTGFRSVDWTTRGAQRGHLITLAGATGVGKTYVLMTMARRMHLDDAKILFVSFEMPFEEIGARYDAIGAAMSTHKLMSGKATSAQMSRMRKEMRRDRSRAPFIITEDIEQATTLSGLRAKIKQHNPDVVYVDGAYMMQDELGAQPGSTQALTNLSRGMKRLALTEGVPILQSVQALESKMKIGRMTLHAVGYTAAYAQDSNVLIGVERGVDDDGGRSANHIILRTLKSRSGPMTVADIHVDWDTSIFEEEEWDDPSEDGDDEDGEAEVHKIF